VEDALAYQVRVESVPVMLLWKLDGMVTDTGSVEVSWIVQDELIVVGDTGEL